MKHVSKEATSKRTAVLLISIAILFGATAIFCGFRAYDAQRQGQESEDAYEELSESYVTVKQGEISVENGTGAPEPEPIYSPIEVNFDDLLGRAARGDVVGWLFCEDTVINYPVAQCDDNVYYLEHSLDGWDNAYGVLFLDCRCNSDFSSRNNIIYGHHMQDGQMFNCLKKWRNISGFYEDHPVMYLNTPYGNYRMDIFSTFVSDTNSVALTTGFENDDDFQVFLDFITENNLLETDIIPTADDRILTLCTCSYEWNDARTYVCGILKEIL